MDFPHRVVQVPYMLHSVIFFLFSFMVIIHFPISFSALGSMFLTTQFYLLLFTAVRYGSSISNPN
jgi:hypothetical protein